MERWKCVECLAYSNAPSRRDAANEPHRACGLRLSFTQTARGARWRLLCYVCMGGIL